MSKVLLPTVLRQHADGSRAIDVDGANVGETLLALVAKYPGLKDQLLDEGGELRNYVNVFLNDTNIRDLENEQTEVSPNDEILIVPALAGG